MIDIQFIRDNPKTVKQAAKDKGYEVDIDKLLALDKKRKKELEEIENLRAKRNANAEAIKQAGKPSTKLIEAGKHIKHQLSKKEEQFAKVEREWDHLLKQVPNLPAKDVPVGASESENKVVKTVGDKPKFDFKPKNHFEIAKSKGWIDKERAAKVAGARFAYVKGDLAKMEFALWQLAIKTLTSKDTLREIIEQNGLSVDVKPFELVLPPAMAKTDVYEATGRLDREEMTYKIENEDLWLNASAEHVMAPLHAGEILNEADLPIRYLGYTTSFRREAGSYGKDMEGIFRLHQFNKMEMESFSTPESSFEEHKLMIAIQEHLMQLLGLPYHVLNKCTADIGFPNARGVDIEVWLPGQNRYRETHTADLITDFQARRMKIRYKSSGGKIGFVHTNDATAFSQRPLIAIIENYQRADGTIAVPEALKPYM